MYSIPLFLIHQLNHVVSVYNCSLRMMQVTYGEADKPCTSVRQKVLRKPLFPLTAVIRNCCYKRNREDTKSKNLSYKDFSDTC